LVDVVAALLAIGRSVTEDVKRDDPTPDDQSTLIVFCPDDDMSAGKVATPFWRSKKLWEQCPLFIQFWCVMVPLEPGGSQVR
jgi:hypothetical protein